MSIKLKEFLILEKELKRKKLLNMLEVFNWWNNIFTEIYELFIELWDDISENFLNNIYEILLSIIENITNENIWEQLNKLEEVRNRFLEIRKQEQEEKLIKLEENELILNQL